MADDETGVRHKDESLRSQFKTFKVETKAGFKSIADEMKHQKEQMPLIMKNMSLQITSDVKEAINEVKTDLQKESMRMWDGHLGTYHNLIKTLKMYGGIASLVTFIGAILSAVVWALIKSGVTP